MTLKLYYFKFPFWRAEVPRIALRHAQLPFEDVRLGWAEFCALRDSGYLPYEQVPVLEVDGEVIAQSGAIIRYCGKLAGLYPEADLDAALVDELIDFVSELNYLVTPSVRERDAERRAAMRAELAEKTLPRWFTRLETRLKGLEPDPWIIGSEVSVADLTVWRFAEWMSGDILDGIPSTILDPYPTVCAVRDHVRSCELIRAYERSNGEAS